MKTNSISNYKSEHHSLQGSSMLQHVSEFTSFLMLSDISLYIYTTLCLFVPEITLECFYFLHIFFRWFSYMEKKSKVTYFPLVLICTY